MSDIEVPDDLPEILRDFTLSVLKNRPDDIIDYAVDYFLRIRNNKLNTDDKQQKTTSTSSKSVTSNHHSSPKENCTTDKQNSFDDEQMIPKGATPNITVDNVRSESFACDGTDSNEEDDVLPEHDLLRRHYVKKNECRRVSVAAERYNPEEDDDSDEEVSNKYPKTVEQRQRLKDAVRTNFLFRTLEAKQIDQVLEAMWEKQVHPGESIIQQGDDGNHFYIIDQGNYSVYVSNDRAGKEPAVKIAEYHQTGAFGELALMYNQPRSATVVADTEGVLWVMGRETFRKLVLKHAFRKRRLYENFLRDLDILKSLTGYERSNLADALIPMEVDQNQIIVKQGDQGDRMYFIEDGQCDVYMNGTFHKRLNKGDYFGELALLNHEPRSATVIAASTKVRLASLEVQSFERLLGPCLNLMHRQTSKYLK